MLKFKKIKKTVSLIMALAFCLCALPTVIAEEPTYALNGTINSVLEIMDGSTEWGGAGDGQITIALQGDKTNGAIFTAYKLLNIVRNTTTNMLEVSIPTDDGKAQAFWNSYTRKTGGTDATINDIKKAIKDKTNDAERSSSIVEEFVNFANKPTGILSTTAVDGKTEITTDFGFYAILQTDAPVSGYIASAPVLACLPMQETDTNGNKTGNWLKSYTVKPKDDTISISKQVKASGDGDTYKDETITNIGDTVSYEIIAELPTYGADIVNSGIAYTIEDTPDPVKDAATNALTLKSDTIKVYYTQNSDKSTNTYTEIPTAAYNNTITIVNNKFTITLDKDYYANYINGNYTYIKITYDATLNENALIEGATSTIDTTYGPGNNNTAKLTYSNTSASTTFTSAIAKVYTMGLDITKIDKDGGATLAGATFEVYTDAAGTEANRLSFIDITGDGGIKRYRVAAPGETGTTTTTIEVTGDGANKGKLMIDGLNDTTYYLKETKAPTGYNLPKDLFEINVKPTAYTDADNKGDYNTGNTALEFDTTRQSENIQNSTGIDLPVTGGMGTVIFTAIGLLLMAGAAYFLFRGKKSSN